MVCFTCRPACSPSAGSITALVFAANYETNCQSVGRSAGANGRSLERVRGATNLVCSPSGKHQCRLARLQLAICMRLNHKKKLEGQTT